MVDRDSNKDAAGLLALLLVPGVGNGGARAALRAARQLGCDIETLMAMTPRVLLDALPPGDHQALAQSIAKCTEVQRVAGRRLVTRCAKAGVTVITIDDERYPDAVRTYLAERAPALLAVTGNRALLNEAGVAVVGAREVSERGRELARACGGDVARAGRVLVSGGANGVDDTAQRGGADRGGNLVVVLPQGLLTFRGPQYFRDLLRSHRVLLMSACLPDAPWKQHAAVERNDIIAALSEVVCVIEPKKTGGSIRTARTSLDFGRHVLVHCQPGSTQGCDDLLRAGARPLCAGGALCEGWLDEALRVERPHISEQTSLPGMD